MLFDIDNILSNSSLSLEIHFNIVFFQINSDCEHPFVQYLLDYHEQIYTTRSFSIFTKELNENDNPALIIQQKYESILKELLQIDDIEPLFKGFLENNGSIFLFFDLTTVENLALKENQIWAILDEIINEKRVLNILVDLGIINIINNNPQLLHIVEVESNNKVPLPVCLYLCEKNTDEENPDETVLKLTENVYKNSIYADNTKSKLLANDSRIEHDIFGFQYFFTSLPIISSPNNKRYAVFVYDTLYILNIKTPLRKINALRQYMVKQNGANDEDANANTNTNTNTNADANANENDEGDESNSVLDDYTSIFFIENNRHTWCIKSIERFVEI